MITLAYITGRMNPRIEWFLDSIAKQDITRVCEILIIDRWRAVRAWFSNAHPLWKRIRWEIPPQSVWQGPNRLTAVDFFNQSNARNGAICLSKGSHICMVDDLSVAGPTFMEAVYRAVDNDYISCGAYRKVMNLKVNNGEVVDYTKYRMGLDPRWKSPFNETMNCPPNWSFGCSLCGPVEAFLKVNGYPEAWTAGLSYEDRITGQTIAKHGYKFRYSREQMTIEDEGLHHEGTPLLRIDPGVSPNDKSHKLLELAASVDRFPNDFGDGITDIRVLRENIQSGGTFPIRTEPSTEWFTGIPLSEFHNYKP